MVRGGGVDATPPLCFSGIFPVDVRLPLSRILRQVQ